LLLEVGAASSYPSCLGKTPLRAWGRKWGGGEGKEELEMASYCSDAVLQSDHRAAMRDTLQGKLAAWGT